MKMKEEIMINEKRNDAAELVFILDRSGSMAGLESDTIGGFNSMIAKQKKQEGECFVTTILFDNEIETLHDRIPLADIKELTDGDYTVRGCTALIDAVGTAVDRVSSIHRYLRPEDVPAHVMFVVTTDGMENASREYTSDKVKKMISEKKELGWEFLFIGANIDAVETAGRFGIDRSRAVNYRADKKGTGVVFKSVAKAVCGMRACAEVDENWASDIKADFESRK